MVILLIPFVSHPPQMDMHFLRRKVAALRKLRLSGRTTQICPSQRETNLSIYIPSLVVLLDAALTDYTGFVCCEMQSVLNSCVQEAFEGDGRGEGLMNYYYRIHELCLWPLD